MVYKNFKDLKLSALGFGAMRLPVSDGSADVIDEAATDEMIAYAMKNGINYYDTAWGYHMGNSETVLGKCLSKYPRDSFYLATKFPGYDLSYMDKVEYIFEEQLKKCGTTYFDFYLLHNVIEHNIDDYLDESHGIVKYLLEQKEKGRIRHLGFSAHGSCEIMERFLQAYGQHMEFGQLQVNYIDWTFQSAKEKVQLLDKYNIPVWVMEPLRGGKLASMSDKDAAKLLALRPEEKIPAWAFRFLQTLPNVTMTLSGMSTMEQLKDNIKTYETDSPLNEAELNTLMEIADGMVREIALPCTSCRYCIKECGQGLDIPLLIALYNENCFSGGGLRAPMRLKAMSVDEHPSACVGCKSCEAVCPQQIKISEAMADFAEKMSKVSSIYLGK